MGYTGYRGALSDGIILPRIREIKMLHGFGGTTHIGFVEGQQTRGTTFTALTALTDVELTVGAAV
jgi:hypothetical protein